jgi:hypothetical protein
VIGRRQQGRHLRHALPLCLGRTEDITESNQRPGRRSRESKGLLILKRLKHCFAKISVDGKLSYWAGSFCISGSFGQPWSPDWTRKTVVHCAVGAAHNPEYLPAAGEVAQRFCRRQTNISNHQTQIYREPGHEHIPTRSSCVRPVRFEQQVRQLEQIAVFLDLPGMRGHGPEPTAGRRLHLRARSWGQARVGFASRLFRHRWRLTRVARYGVETQEGRRRVNPLLDPPADLSTAQWPRPRVRQLDVTWIEAAPWRLLSADKSGDCAQLLSVVLKYTPAAQFCDDCGQWFQPCPTAE